MDNTIEGRLTMIQSMTFFIDRIIGMYRDPNYTRRGTVFEDFEKPLMFAAETIVQELRELSAEIEEIKEMEAE